MALSVEKTEQHEWVCIAGVRISDEVSDEDGKRNGRLIMVLNRSDNGREETENVQMHD